ncbi:MAG: JAB domain-containing protein [Flavobacteriales bacterium]|nr:JAB domain-containing protein [Flavobacteriales bacterium]
MSVYSNLKDEFNSTPTKEFMLCEINLNYRTYNIQTPFRIGTSQDAEEVLRKTFDPNTIEMREEIKVIFLNRGNQVLGVTTLSQGGVSGTVCDVKLLMATALKSLASGIIIAHNHPSGNLKPSEADNQITEQIKHVGKFFDIVLLDQLILSKNGYYSYADSMNL